MKSISVRVILRKVDDQVLVIPATASDKTLLDSYVSETEGKYVSVDLKSSGNKKTFDQVKTAWALIDVLFQSIWFKRPTESQRKQFYQEILSDYSQTGNADKIPSLLHKGTSVTIGMSDMDKKQLSKFIQYLISLIAESCDLEEAEQMAVVDIFKDWQEYKSSLEVDPEDCDEAGNFLTIDKWRAAHTVSFASGIGGDLDLAHIVSKGADEVHRDCCWNTMMLTHEEHMMQHRVGWNKFLEIYPHLRGRVERARRLAGKLALREV